MANPDQNARRADGRYIPTQAAADRAAEAARLKAANPRMTYQQIADAVGYSHKKVAWAAIQRCRESVVRKAGADLIAAEADHLDDLFVAALEVLERDHITVSHGKVIKDDDDNVILDDGPKLAAIDRLVKVRESYRKLLGLDAAQKIDATIAAPQDTELQEMLRQARERVSTEEQAIRDGEPDAG